MPIQGLMRPNRDYWFDFSLDVGFRKNNKDNVIDGLTLEISTLDGSFPTEFAVPWGNDHEARTRQAAHYGETHR